MYRAKAEAVSGNKVYAGGKWLTCIGNKNVCVGEMIWTDGRCVYGNFRESQQPLVITAPLDVEEGIPIITTGGGLYSFSKIKLKQNATLEKKYNLMINDYKKNVFVSNDSNIIAANIDKDGNVFLLRANDAPNKNVQILKNDNVIKEIDLDKEAEKHEDLLTINFVDFHERGIAYEIEDLPHSYLHGVSVSHGIDSAFIENENSWYLTLHFIVTAIRRSYFYAHGDWDITGDLTVDTDNPWVQQCEAWILACIQPSGNEALVATNRFPARYPDPSVDFFPRIGYDSTYDFLYKDFKIPLGDGYYAKLNHIALKDKEEETTEIGGGYSHGAEATIFTPNGKEITSFYYLFTFYHESTPKFLITKKRAGFLFQMNKGVFWKDTREQFEKGLYIYKDNNWKYLGGGESINQRLRPMKRIKNWQKRIKEL